MKGSERNILINEVKMLYLLSDNGLCFCKCCITGAELNLTILFLLLL